MAYLRPYRVAEMSTTTGTGSIAVAGAVTGYLAFSAELANADTVTIVIEAVDSSGQPTGAWEICDSTFTSPATLTRGTIRDSSAGGSRINFAAGNKRVFAINPRDAVNLSSSDVTGTLSVANGGTGASTLNSGSVVFAGPTGVYSEDYSNFFWNYVTNCLGIRTGNPTAALDVNGDANFEGTVVNGRFVAIGLGRYFDAVTETGLYFFTRAGGTDPDSGVTEDASFLRSPGVNGNLDLVNKGTGSIAITAENAGAVVTKTSNTERMRVTGAGNVGIGTNTPAVKLEVSSAPVATAPVPTEIRISSTTDSSSWLTTSPWGRLSFYSADLSDAGPKIQGVIDAIADGPTGARMSMVFSTSTASSGLLTERMRLSADGSITLITNQVAGLLTAGGPSGTGTITLGQSTASQTTNIQAGATASGSTKTINIGTGGLSGSTTTITIGSTLGSTTSAQGSWSFTAGATTSIFTLGVTAGTGTITLGRSTASQTTDIQAGVTASGSTKTINLGTNGASGSTTNITIGSAVSGATQTTTINGNVTLAPIGASAEAWTTSGIALTQSAATFTDTTSSGTVADIRINNFAAQTLAASSAVTVTQLYGTYFTSPAAGTNVTATERLALGADSLRVSGAATFSSTFTIVGGANTVGLGTSQASGQIIIGGTSATGTITLGRSTASQTTNIQAGATASGLTKTINLGTGGLSGSTTTINIGSADGTNNINLNAPIRMAAYTVATLPAAGTAGRRAYVTDATAPTFLGALTGGGAVVSPVFDTGTAWVAG